MSISIPALHVTTKASVKGSARVFIESRKDATHPGTFDIKIDVRFDASLDDYPVLTSLIITSQMNDASGPALVTYTATTIELMNSYGKYNPTIFFTGRCRSSFQELKGCKYWVMIANNKPVGTQGTPDIVGFAITDRNGTRVAYGTGPVQSGDLDVAGVNV
ncbi:MAG: hypothetical protein WKF89_08190 [Chitinophagaceae bacterium]